MVFPAFVLGICKYSCRSLPHNKWIYYYSPIISLQFSRPLSLLLFVVLIQAYISLKKQLHNLWIDRSSSELRQNQWVWDMCKRHGEKQEGWYRKKDKGCWNKVKTEIKVCKLKATELSMNRKEKVVWKMNITEGWQRFFQPTQFLLLAITSSTQSGPSSLLAEAKLKVVCAHIPFCK